jgi:hypothetical protein
LIFTDKAKLNDLGSHYFHGEPVPVRAIELEGKYLVFASFVSDEELTKVFAGIPVLSPGQ